MAGRDSRADILDDDPFRNQKPRVHRVHSRQSEDGTIHFETGANARVNPLFAQMMGFAQQQPAQMHKGKIWHFSAEEKKHLRLATAAFTVALGFMAVGGVWGIQSNGFTSWFIQFFLSMPVLLLAVGPAFLLHEIGHKTLNNPLNLLYLEHNKLLRAFRVPQSVQKVKTAKFHKP